MKIITKKGAIRLAILFALLLLLSIWGWACMVSMPGSSHAGDLPPLTDEEGKISGELRAHVEELAGRLKARNTWAPAELSQAADYVEARFRDAGWTVSRQTYSIGDKPCHNLEVEVRGASKPEEIVIVGAHYDSVFGCPGANDNGSGTAGLLALARLLAGQPRLRTLRFVAFVNEEPPHFLTGDMGSVVYAKRCKERGENVVAMLSLETIGYYSDEKGSQKYPPPFGLLYPSKGNFIAFVGNVSSRALVRQAVRTFRDQVKFPSEGGALPGFIAGVGWSDHWSFWQQGWPAIMVTDTAPFRYPHYHLQTDTPDRVDYDRCARVVAGLVPVIRELTE